MYQKQGPERERFLSNFNLKKGLTDQIKNLIKKKKNGSTYLPAAIYENMTLNLFKLCLHLVGIKMKTHQNVHMFERWADARLGDFCPNFQYPKFSLSEN